MKSILNPKIVVRLVSFFAVFSLLILSSTAYVAAQQGYQPLTAIPRVNTNHPDLISYINALFLLSIALGAMLAVVKIALAGFTYMMSDVVTRKESAREQITGALIGLGILLATFVVLYTINPNLTNLDVLSGATNIPLTQKETDSKETDTNPCTTDPSSDACKAKQCEQSGGQYIQTNRGVFYECRMPAPSQGNCDGYYEPHTGVCYGTVQYIELDPSFDSEPGDIRRMECLRIGGVTYDDESDQCISYQANN